MTETEREELRERVMQELAAVRRDRIGVNTARHEDTAHYENVIRAARVDQAARRIEEMFAPKMVAVRFDDLATVVELYSTTSWPQTPLRRLREALSEAVKP